MWILFAMARVLVNAGRRGYGSGMTNGKGRTALVTGATDGVGRVVAAALGKDGWRVLVHGRDRKRGEALVQEIGQAGGSATFLQADLASLAEVRRLADEVQSAMDRLDLLINNAGIGTAGTVAGRQTSIDGHELRFAVNYLAGFLLTLRAAAAHQGCRAGAHRQRLVGRPAGDRFLDVMLTALQRRCRLLPEQARPDHVHHRSRRGTCRARGVIVNALHPSTYMNTTMVRQRRHLADEPRRGWRRGDPAARRIAQARRARAASISTC